MRGSRGMGAMDPKKIPRAKKHKQDQKPVATLPPVFDPHSHRDMHRRVTRAYP